MWSCEKMGREKKGYNYIPSGAILFCKFYGEKSFLLGDYIYKYKSNDYNN